MLKRVLGIILVFMFAAASAEPMTQEQMETIVKGFTEKANGEKGAVEFVYNNVAMALVSNQEFDRMRILAPIARYADLSREQIDISLAANFHRALDARYALSNGILYSVYIHPLSSLDEAQLRSAIFQVANLALSFGSGYTSGMLDFGAQQRGQSL